MDWSLALASQGIEAVIQNDPEWGWQLGVAPTEHERALAIIEQYRRENLRWLWRQPVGKSHAVFDWASLLWILLAAGFFRFNVTLRDFRPVGMMDTHAVAQGEWWRVFTATVLHADLLHFATNAVFGLILLGLAMGRYGTGMGLLAAYLAGAAGNLVSWLVHDGMHRGLGASGVVMGALGLLAPQSISGVRRNPRMFRSVIAGLAAGTMLFVLLGLSPGTDVAAHFGGFFAGVLLGSCLALGPRRINEGWVHVLAGMVFVALVIMPWLMALQSRH